MIATPARTVLQASPGGGGLTSDGSPLVQERVCKLIESEVNNPERMQHEYKEGNSH